MSYDEARVDTAAVIDDDLLISALAAGERVDDGGICSFLSAWRVELDSAVRTIAVTDLARARSRRGSRRVVAATAAIALATGGGVAAAVAAGPTGPLGGLHRILFGGTVGKHVDANHARTLLDDADRRIATAQLSGFISPLGRSAVAELLNRAASQLHEATGADSLRTRLTTLRRKLAELPGPSAVTPVGPPAQHQSRLSDPGRSATAPGLDDGDHNWGHGNHGRPGQQGDQGRHGNDRTPRGEGQGHGAGNAGGPSGGGADNRAADSADGDSGDGGSNND